MTAPTSENPLKARITEDMKLAMKARDAARLSSIRLLLSAVKQREVDERKDLSNAEVLAVIDKMLKQRRDSIKQFEAAGRNDLAATEKFEVEVLCGYTPQALSDAEVAGEVDAAIAASGARGPADMGKVMAILKGKLAGRADMGKVSALLKGKLAA